MTDSLNDYISTLKGRLFDISTKQSELNIQRTVITGVLWDLETIADKAKKDKLITDNS
jgi:hypothetical protein